MRNSLPTALLALGFAGSVQRSAGGWTTAAGTNRVSSAGSSEDPGLGGEDKEDSFPVEVSNSRGVICRCLETQHHRCGCHGRIWQLLSSCQASPELWLKMKRIHQAVLSLILQMPLRAWYTVDPAQGSGDTAGWSTGLPEAAWGRLME